jgi:hypothetical protein
MANETQKEKDDKAAAERAVAQAAAHETPAHRESRRDAQARERRLHPPPEIRFVSPFEDPDGLITPPLCDPIANSTGLPIPPAVIDETLLPEEPSPVLTGGMILPDLATLSGKEQELVEIYTGKRLQRPESALVPTREEEHQAARASSSRLVGRPVAPSTRPVAPPA